MPSRVSAVAFVIAIFAILGTSAQAQQLVATEYGKNNAKYFGTSVAGGPDLDGDGFSEVAIGAPGEKPSFYAGIVAVLSGRDFSTVVVLKGLQNEFFGHSVCWCGDLDGDGLSELAVGVPDGNAGIGEVQIFSSATWTVLRTLTVAGSEDLGWSLANGGDFDGDGFDDLLVGDPARHSVGTITRFSGKDGSVLQSIASTVTGAEFGDSIAVVGDGNGDGVADLAVGSPRFDATSHHEDAGAVDLRSGADGSLLWQHVGEYYYYNGPYGHFWFGDQLGWTLAGAGDVDGDGIPDVAVATSGGSERTVVLSGKDGSFLRRILIGYADTSGTLASIGDLTGDGLPEIGVAYYSFDTSFAILSSFDGKVLWRTDAFSSVPAAAIGAISDVNADGLPDLLLGVPRDATRYSYNGRAELRTTNDLWLDASTHRPSPRQLLNFELRGNEGVPGNLAALVLTGLNGAPLFQPLVVTSFDASRSALFYSGKVPSGFFGNTVDLRAIAVGPTGRLIQSADEAITFQ